MQNERDMVAKLMQNIGQRVKCPKCGQEGILAVDKFRSKGRVYTYLVVRHRVNGGVRRHIIARVLNAGGAKPLQNKEQNAKRVLQVDAKLAKSLKTYYIKKKGYTQEEKEEAKNFVKEIVTAVENGEKVEVCIYT